MAVAATVGERVLLLRLLKGFAPWNDDNAGRSDVASAPME